jgi:hypothetical protein
MYKIFLSFLYAMNIGVEIKMEKDQMMDNRSNRNFERMFLKENREAENSEVIKKKCMNVHSKSMYKKKEK